MVCGFPDPKNTILGPEASHTGLCPPLLPLFAAGLSKGSCTDLSGYQLAGVTKTPPTPRTEGRPRSPELLGTSGCHTGEG